MAAVPALQVQAPVSVVPYDLFCQADLRIGRVLSAVPVAGSRQSLCQITVEVDGWGIGIAMSKIPGVAPAALVGNLAVVACNIEPRSIAGVFTSLLLVTVRTPDQTQSSILIPEALEIGSGCLVR